MPAPIINLQWQPDNAAQDCFLCNEVFTFFNRRHHCRKCGRVVCSSCSDQEIKYFPQTAIVDADNTVLSCREHRIYRTCDECVAEIRTLRSNLGISSFQDQTVASNRNGTNGTNGNVLTGLTGLTGTSSETNNSTIIKHASVVSARPVNMSSSTLATTNRTDGESDHNLCPVCATNLLSLFLTNFEDGNEANSLDALESFKEAHISECLVAFDFTNEHMRLQSPPSGSYTRNRMLVYNIPPIPQPIYEIVGDARPNSLDTIVRNKEICGLLVSNQSLDHEKDLIDDECVICLEDLKPGDKVGRLECLCVFHYKCIKDWFSKKSYGECPVHFLHK